MGMERYDVREIASRMGIDVVRTPLKYARGYTDGHSTIWVHDGLGEAEERSTICHEVIHVSLGHVEEQPPEIEEMVRCATARWLVPWHRLATACSDGRTVECIAAELVVTVDVVRDRIKHATSEELLMARWNSKQEWVAA